MAQLKVYISKDLEPVISSFAEDNYTKPSEMVSMLLSFVVDLLEETGAKSIPELKEILEDRSPVSTQKYKVESKEKTPELTKPKKPNGNAALNSL